MMRIRNEGEFLEPAVRSIEPLMDEIVLVDNMSSDDTADVILRLTSRFPEKIVTYQYEHEVARVGSETWRLASDSAGVRSPRLTSNYYNWCLRHCAGPYILKWDGDMIALNGFRQDLRRWKLGRNQVLVMQGINVHPSLEHVIVSRNTDRASLLQRLEVPGLPGWVTDLTSDFPEPRLFPKLFARYSSDSLWTQALRSPFWQPSTKRRYSCRLSSPSFLHLKFCKQDPFANYSSDLAEVIASNIGRGSRLDSAHREELTRWGVTGSLE